MPHRRIDLIALDLDGTLLDARDAVSAENRRAIAAARALGVRVVLVTGRGVNAAARVGSELGLDLPAICAHGALVKDVLADRVVAHHRIPLPVARALLQFAQAERLEVAVYLNERFHHAPGSTHFMDEQRGPHWCEVESLLDAVQTPPTMIRFLGRPAVAGLRGGPTHLPLHYKYESWGEFEECALTHPEASKERALAALCTQIGVASARVLALGDSRNDVPMLRWAGVGVAMGNANAEVRAAVGRVTASCDRDGVAAAIDRYVLNDRDREMSA